MTEWQICALLVLAWANGIFFGWIRWRKPQLDEAIKRNQEKMCVYCGQFVKEKNT